MDEWMKLMAVVESAVPGTCEHPQVIRLKRRAPGVCTACTSVVRRGA